MTLGRRLSTFFYRHPRVGLAVLLAVPVGWLVVGYLGSLFVLLLALVLGHGPFTSEVVHTFTLDNFRRIIEQDVYREVAWRTVRMAALVTVADAVLAFPIAYYMARVASTRTRNLLVVAVLCLCSPATSSRPTPGGRFSPTQAPSTGRSSRSVSASTATRPRGSGSSSPTCGCRS